MSLDERVENFMTPFSKLIYADADTTLPEANDLIWQHKLNMKMMDSAAYAAARRYARSNVVTARVDELEFHLPILIGDLVVCTADIVFVGHSSMEIAVNVEVEDLEHAIAYLEKLMPETKAEEVVVVCLSGRGDKDVQMVAKRLGEEIE